eukprot:5541839-Prymnesium_polylepis.2
MGHHSLRHEETAAARGARRSVARAAYSAALFAPDFSGSWFCLSPSHRMLLCGLWPMMRPGGGVGRYARPAVPLAR